MYTLGIDIGSTTSKCAVIKDGKELVAHSLQTGGLGTGGPEEAMAQLWQSCGLTRQDMACAFVTGYGRKNYEGADGEISELTAHALGGRFVFPDLRTVIDIGGQDTKVIGVSGGAVQDFLMNDKCSAGTGRFLEIMANRLGMRPEELCALAARGGGASISSICTVFAESEVVSLIGQGAPREDIAYAVVDSIAGKVVTQAKKLGGSYGAVCLTGGLCQTEYLPDAIAERLGAPVLTHPQGRFAGAIGAALAARRLSR